MTNPRPAVKRAGPQGAKAQAQRLVGPSEGNEARPEGPRESHSLIVPLKQGNLDRGDPGEGRGLLLREPGWGHSAGARPPNFEST